ncbi:unnamed protein product [Rangifer tarandus platyrhynchus]|uniref:Uncharacterized protein n=2 Tax=Rangifer tarandus platyrhynchus TaxID=3082113 RepID=A0ACB0FM23_RANTA|nr:unnamed protein product [Rangifer tarandus platyrhynchus]CAI9713046.1 unnamed protein product [Rangifer tarandus platyrhynchus]
MRPQLRSWCLQALCISPQELMARVGMESGQRVSGAGKDIDRVGSSFPEASTNRQGRVSCLQRGIPATWTKAMDA